MPTPHSRIVVVDRRKCRCRSIFADVLLLVGHLCCCSSTARHKHHIHESLLSNEESDDVVQSLLTSFNWMSIFVVVFYCTSQAHSHESVLSNERKWHCRSIFSEVLLLVVHLCCCLLHHRTITIFTNRCC